MKRHHTAVRGLALGMAFAVTQALVLPVASAGTALAESYVIDTKGQHASINFKVSHLGFSWLTGRFDTFSGTFEFDQEAPEQSQVSVEIDTASVNSNHAARDKHLRSDDFLQVGTHPKATFESTDIEVTGEDTAKITGDFTFLGVTKPVTIDTKFIGEGKDPWGGHRAGFSGTTSFQMDDFGVKKDLGPASGTVYLDLHVEGIRQ